MYTDQAKRIVNRIVVNQDPSTQVGKKSRLLFHRSGCDCSLPLPLFLTLPYTALVVGGCYNVLAYPLCCVGCQAEMVVDFQQALYTGGCGPKGHASHQIEASFHYHCPLYISAVNTHKESEKEGEREKEESGREREEREIEEEREREREKERERESYKNLEQARLASTM